jgi:hypothetical protein
MMRTARSRRIACSIATACAAVAAVAFATAPPASSATSATSATSARPEVSLLVAGSEPRAPLRLSLLAGTVSEGELVYSQTFGQTIDGKPGATASLPPFRFTLSTTVESIGADGNADVTSTYGDVQVVDDGSVSDATREQLETALQPLTKISGRSTVTPRNEYLDSSVSGTEALPAEVAQIVDELGQQSSSLAVPFPVEAVGVGARWRVTTALETSGIRARQQYEYTLRARDGNDVTLDMKFVQTAPHQRAELPGAPANAKVQVTKWRVTGSGTSTLDLATPFPVEAQTHAAGTQEFSVRYSGESGTLSQKVAVDVTASSTPDE